MGQNQDTALNEQFLKYLRIALNHLYDPDELRQNPLASFFHVEGHFDTPSAIQRILTRAIESFKTQPELPSYTHNQKVYELLLYRYIQHISQDEYAHQLGLSVRQFRREQKEAIYELGDRLWQEYAGNALGAGAALVPEPDIEDEYPVDIAREPDHSDEFTWLKNMSPEKTTDVTKTVDSVMGLIAPLALQKGIAIRHHPVEHYLLAVHPVALQQVLLGLLSYGMDQTSSHNIDINFLHREQFLDIIVSYPISSSASNVSPLKEPELGMIRSILELSAGTMNYSTDANLGTMCITFAIVKPRTVLVIEDNDDIVDLMQRYVHDMNFNITSVRNPARSIDEAIALHPDLIILDIMMPQIDGLEVLTQITHHHKLSGIPVVVCSVLPQQKLALALGASGFLQKPIRRDTFIAALEHHSTS